MAQVQKSVNQFIKPVQPARACVSQRSTSKDKALLPRLSAISSTYAQRQSGEVSAWVLGNKF